MAWRTAGRVGCGGGPLFLFFPLRRFKAAVLQEGIGDHRHERMTVKTLPGSSFEVIKAKFFFHLLMSLFAYPSRLDGGSQGSQVGRRRQVGEVVFFLSRHPMFADEPSLVARQIAGSINGCLPVSIGPCALDLLDDEIQNVEQKRQYLGSILNHVSYQF